MRELWLGSVLKRAGRGLSRRLRRERNGHLLAYIEQARPSSENFPRISHFTVHGISRAPSHRAVRLNPKLPVKDLPPVIRSIQIVYFDGSGNVQEVLRQSREEVLEAMKRAR